MKSHFNLIVWITACSALLGGAGLVTRAADAIPPVTFSVQPVEPDENGSLVYSLVGAESGDLSATGRFWLSLKITNQGGADLRLNKIQTSFLTGLAGFSRQFSRDSVVPAGATRSASLADDEVITLSLPAPAVVLVSLFFDGYTQPKSVQRALVPYTSPAPNGKYFFPVDEGDIGPNEYFSGSTHGPSSGQLWGADWKLYQVTASGYSNVETGGDDTNNQDHFGWGVPIRAMADGVVLRTSTGWMNNPTAGTRAFQKMGEYAGEAINDVKVTRLGATNAASLVRLPSGNTKITIWGLADKGREITPLGSSPVSAAELTSEIALDALTASRLVTAVRLNSGICRLIVWDIAEGGHTVTRRWEADDVAVTEVSLMKISSSRFATGVRTAAGDLRVAVWELADNRVNLLAHASAGAASSINTTVVSNSRLATSLRTAQGALKVIVWDLLDDGNGKYSLNRKGDSTADTITRIVATKTIGSKWTTAVRTSPGGGLKLIRWGASADGQSVTRELETTGGAIQDQALAISPATGSDGPDNIVTASILAGGEFKINGWGDPDKLPGSYEFSAQNQAGFVNRLSIDETDDLQFFAGARTSAGNLKIMTWSWAHGGGNSVYVLHGNCRILYAHFQEGSVDTTLLYPGAPVFAGQVLGRMGNSGASGGPHTHIHSDRIWPMSSVENLIALEAAGALPIIGTRPIPFHSARTMRLSAIDRGGEGNPGNDFSTMNGHGMYEVALGIRPRIKTLYVDKSSTCVNAAGWKECLPGLHPSGGPFPTLAPALSVAGSGTQLYIRGGSYHEPVTISTPMMVRRYDYYRTSGAVLIGN